MAVFWIAVIAGIVLLIRWFAVRTPEARPAGEESAVEILRRRYARGELTREQFQEMRRDIEETGRAAGEAI
ncbi:MAG: SHOCT domain-containing protein [Armatimonadetes bacterium]|nr:SHOCT domain-containing protein [Armatimonadota bacterium]